jgi:glutamate carboxypeptidase
MLSEVERHVCDCIARRAGALEEDLRRLVDLPTGPGGDGMARTRELLTGRAAKLGATVDLVPGEPRPKWLYSDGANTQAGSAGEAACDPQAHLPIAICRREHGTGVSGTPVLIAGHIDTVHAALSGFRRLSIAPDGSKATGPGCVDMKGGLAIAMHALEALDEAGARRPWTLLLNSDEETGSFASAKAIRLEARRTAKTGGVGIALEPSLPDGSIVTERSGSGQFMIEAHGRASHVGRDFAAGRSAVNALAHAVLSVAELSDPSLGLIASIGPLQGGATTNSVPDVARAWGNLRFPDAHGAERLRQELTLICNSTPFAGTSLRLEMALARPAKPATAGTRRLAEIVRSAGADLGQTIAFAKTGGVCDGNLMQGEGLPTLDTLGVRGGGLHTTDEWIDLPSLVERCQLLALTIVRA